MENTLTKTVASARNTCKAYRSILSAESRGFRLPESTPTMELLESLTALGWSASLPESDLPLSTRQYCAELARGIAEQVRERMQTL